MYCKWQISVCVSRQIHPPCYFYQHISLWLCFSLSISVLPLEIYFSYLSCLFSLVYKHFLDSSDFYFTRSLFHVFFLLHYYYCLLPYHFPFILLVLKIVLSIVFHVVCSLYFLHLSYTIQFFHCIFLSFVVVTCFGPLIISLALCLYLYSNHYHVLLMVFIFTIIEFTFQQIYFVMLHIFFFKFMFRKLAVYICVIVVT